MSRVTKDSWDNPWDELARARAAMAGRDKKETPTEFIQFVRDWCNDSKDGDPIYGFAEVEERAAAVLARIKETTDE